MRSVRRVRLRGRERKQNAGKRERAAMAGDLLIIIALHTRERQFRCNRSTSGSHLRMGATESEQENLNLRHDNLKHTAPGIEFMMRFFSFL